MPAVTCYLNIDQTWLRISCWGQDFFKIANWRPGSPQYGRIRVDPFEIQERKVMNRSCSCFLPQ